MNLEEYKDLIENKPIHIATVTKDNKPNLAVAADVRIIESDKIIVSVNEMVNTQENVKRNPNVVITVFNDEWVGLRIFGKAKYYESGKYYDFCNKTFFGNDENAPFDAKKPKGALVITIDKIEEFK